MTTADPPPSDASGSSPVEPASEGMALAGTTIDLMLRVGLVALLAGWSLWIAQPFILPILWGGIIAIALEPLHSRLASLLGGRPGLAGALIAVLGVALMLGPLAGLGLALAGAVREIAGAATRGELTIPSQPDWLRDVPLIGPELSDYWQLATTNLRDLLSELEPQIREFGFWLLGLAGGLGLSFLAGLLAVIVAGILLAWRDTIIPALHRLAARVAGERGEPLLLLGEETVQAVARGVVGTAFIQGLVAAITFIAVGLPAGAFWGFVVFLLGLVQLGPLPVTIPVAIWAVSQMAALPLALFLAWLLLVTLMDNVLRPLLIGAGARVPLLVLLIGVVGGLLAHGLLGLFVGPVVVALAYTLLVAWLARRS